jgi:hypothetical protein
MDASSATKVCPHCAETIRAAAKVCPHCRLWQERWSLYNPLIFVAVSFIVLAGSLAYLDSVIGEHFSSKEDFADFRGKITAVNSQVSLRNTGSNVMAVVVGILTNNSDLAWKQVGVEVQFLDKAGKAFDVIPVKADDYSGIGMLPHAEGAFKVEGRAARPQAVYTNYNVVVRWAQDARKLF